MGLGNSFGFGSKGGKGGGGSFNGNRPITLPGITNLTGKVLGGNTIKDFLEGLFPAEPPHASLTTSNSTRLFGASTSVVLSYTATKKTYPISALTVAGQSIPVTGNTQSGTINASTAPNTDTTFSMNVVAGSTSASALAYVLYRHYRFWFKSSQDLLGLTDAELSTFLNALSAGTFEFSTSKDHPVRTFNCNNEFIYFANPASFGTSTFVVNGLSNNAFVSKDFQFANANNYNTLFRLERSGNQLTGTYNVDKN